MDWADMYCMGLADYSGRFRGRTELMQVRPYVNPKDILPQVKSWTMLGTNLHQAVQYHKRRL